MKVISSTKIKNVDTPYVTVKTEHFGSNNVLFTHAFLTKEDLQEFKKQKEETLKENYRNQINSINDLVKFMYTHCVAAAEEYTDWDARTVVEEKAKEFGINLK